ncbi:autophagy protein 5 [Coemansia sp. RSA 1804]|nr:autophagy protein 5 [Coemansia sp. RSA 1804]
MESVAKRRVWQGMIPIELQLSGNDSIELLASATLPEPFQTFYMLVPRVSYLPFVTSKIKEQWLDPMLSMSGTRVAAPGTNGGNGATGIRETEMWFEYKKQPLKWHYPVGLLYDMLVSSNSSNDTTELPWALTLHVRKFPQPAKVVPNPSVQSMRDMVMAMIKEADFIRNGSTKRVMGLAKSDQMQLLDGIEDHSFEKFFAIHSTIVTTVSGGNSHHGQGGKQRSGGPKAIPIRFYMASESAQDAADGKEPSALSAAAAGAGAAGGGGDMAQFHISQYPVPPLVKDDSEQKTTLADAFRVCYEISDQAGDAFVTNCACLCQGVSVPWETPVVWMAENFHYADCFLHLVVVRIAQ